MRGKGERKVSRERRNIAFATLRNIALVSPKFRGTKLITETRSVQSFDSLSLSLSYLEATAAFSPAETWMKVLDGDVYVGGVDLSSHWLFTSKTTDAKICSRNWRVSKMRNSRRRSASPMNRNYASLEKEKKNHERSVFFFFFFFLFLGGKPGDRSCFRE